MKAFSTVRKGLALPLRPRAFHILSILVVGVLEVIPSRPVFSQTSGVLPRQVRATQLAELGDTLFSAEVVGVPLRFSDISTLYQRLAEPGKGDFETVDAYHSRIVRRVSARQKSVYAFPLSVEFSYDLETGYFSGFLPTEERFVSLPWFPGGTVTGFIVDSSVIAGKPRDAQNAFGAQVTVTPIHQTNYVVWSVIGGNHGAGVLTIPNGPGVGSSQQNSASCGAACEPGAPCGRMDNLVSNG